MSGAALVFHQFRYDQKTFWRDPASVFFTVLLPLIFLFIFATIFGNETIEELGGIKTSTYYVPAIITLAVVSATMVSPAISLTQDRENGVLKRVRGTPLPSWVFIAGRVGNAVVISLLMAVVLTLIGTVRCGAPAASGNLKNTTPAEMTKLRPFTSGAASAAIAGEDASSTRSCSPRRNTRKIVSSVSLSPLMSCGPSGSRNARTSCPARSSSAPTA